MLSCRKMKGTLIFVPVLMHRETNLQVENEETIEAQSARTPKALLDGIQQRFFIWCANFRCWCKGVPPHSARPRARLIPSSPFSPSLPVDRRWRAAACAWPSGLTRLACAKSVRYTQLSPTVRSGKGRQFSYKQNAEEGVRLDEKRGTMDRGARGGWRRSFGVGGARLCPGVHEPSCGRHARSGAICRHDGLCGRCVRIRRVVRVRMNGRFFDPASPACGAEPGPAGRPSDDRCVRIDRVSRNAAFLHSVHPDDITAAHRGGRTTVSQRAAARARAVSPGLDGGAGVSRENERRRGSAR